MPPTHAEFSFLAIGQDSEFFLWDPLKEKLVPSYDYFETREESAPIKVEIPEGYIHPTNALQGPNRPIAGLRPKWEDSWRGTSRPGPFRVFRDGLAVELNTPAVGCRELLYNNVRLTLRLAESMLPEGHQLTFTDRPVVEIPEEMKASFPADCRTLGCNPTLDAYTQGEKILEVDPLELNFRTSGAHLHMSLVGNRGASIPPELWTGFIKAADLLIGVPFAYIFNDELEKKRRTLYGQAGEFRFQDYTRQEGTSSKTTGLEYRVLSSRLWSHVSIASLFTGIWKYVLGRGPRVQQLVNVWDPAWEDDIREAINTLDEKALDRALALCVKHFPASTSYFDYASDNPLVGLTHGREAEIAGRGFDTELPPTIWKDLREARKRGVFKDGMLLEPSHPSGTNYGWREYFRDNFGHSPLRAR